MNNIMDFWRNEWNAVTDTSEVTKAEFFLETDEDYPNGYYNKSGQYLGTDTNDGKVYVADKKEYMKDEQGNEKLVFIQAKDLGVSHYYFKVISNIIKQESSGNKDETLWIAHAANNAAKASKKTLYNKLMSSYSSVKNKTPLSEKDNKFNANNARYAVIHVLTGEADPTGGARLWDGVDFIARGTEQNKFKEYRHINIHKEIYEAYLAYSLRLYPSGKYIYRKQEYDIPHSVFLDIRYWGNDVFRYNTGLEKHYQIEATGTNGGTIFWKLISI